MADMLVKLYSLPGITLDALKGTGVSIRRPLSSEKSRVISWVRDNFSAGWADECDKTFSHSPITTYIAVATGEIAGFASYDAACRNYFGPTGVLDNFRGKGIGEALLMHSLTAIKEQGYGYAIIGGVGPAAFYTKTVGAVLIEGSVPGIYSNPLTKK